MAPGDRKRFPLASASLAGTLENCATYPFEFVKTQLQLQVSHSKFYSGASKFSGPADCLARTLRTSGAIGMYRGASPWFIFAAPRTIFRFTTFEKLSNSQAGAALKERAGKPTAELCFGLVAGVGDGVSQCVYQAVSVKLVHDTSPRGPRQCERSSARRAPPRPVARVRLRRARPRARAQIAGCCTRCTRSTASSACGGASSTACCRR